MLFRYRCRHGSGQHVLIVLKSLVHFEMVSPSVFRDVLFVPDVLKVVCKVAVVVLVGVVAVGAMLTIAFGKEMAKEHVVWNCLLRILPVVGLPAL